MVVVLTDKVTIGELTFILRVAIRILTYGGLFLLGFIILGHAPYTGSVETHDVLNRTVGKATATKASLKWIRARLFNSKKDPSASRFLVLAILLSLSYSLLSLLTDVGFIGLQPCEISGSPFNDFPASVKATSDAQDLMAKNMVNGTDPANVRSYRCEGSTPRDIGGAEYQVCTSWLNTTFADAETFKKLNLSDTDSLFPRTLGRYKYRNSDAFDLNMYFVGTQGQPLWNATLERGLAIVPHDAGVRMVVGVPNLGLQQRVTIPQTTAVEVDVTCMPLGIAALDSATAFGDNSFDMLQVDEPYKATRLNRSSGPEYLRDFLPKYADQVRDLVRPLFNVSTLNNGYITSFNRSTSNQGWQTTVERYTIPTVGVPSTSSPSLSDVLQACSDEVQTGTSALIPRSRTYSRACGLYRLKGSFAENSIITLGHSVMLCATATQVNMVSAVVNKDADGTVTANITHIPSDIRMMQADYYDVTQTQPMSTTEPARWGSIMRYTHTANPNGQPRHFIFQRYDGRTTPFGLAHGVGSAGQILSLVGSAVLNVGSGAGDEATLSLINPAYMSIDVFRASYVTRWAGAVGAAFLYHSLTYNPWVSLGQSELTVQRTGGVKATCYNPPYGLAFLPLVLAAVFVLLWYFLLLLGRRIFGTKVVEQMYGGLGPAIVTPYPIKRNPDDLYVWQGAEGCDPHLVAVTNGTPVVGNQKLSLVRQLKVVQTYDDGEK